MIKPVSIFLPAIILLSAVSSCNTPSDTDKNMSNSYELNLSPPYDTINFMVNGLKQGKWIETINGKKDTLYYRNDTLIATG